MMWYAHVLMHRFFMLTQLITGYSPVETHYLLLLADDDGREVRQQHMGPSEECHPGNSEEEQQRPEF